MPVDEHQSAAESPNGAGSSPGSWAAGSNPFVGNAGQFDPETAGEQAATPLLQPVEETWLEPRVRTILRAQGLLTHETIGVGVEDWLWRDAELLAISEPLANAMNKIPVLRAAAAVSDELTAGAVFFEYAARSIKERAQVLRARQAEAPPAPRPVTGYDAAGERVEPPPAPDQVRWETPGA